jgi:hypothetical protein
VPAEAGRAPGAGRDRDRGLDSRKENAAESHAALLAHGMGFFERMLRRRPWFFRGTGRVDRADFARTRPGVTATFIDRGFNRHAPRPQLMIGSAVAY